ncbi:MAG: tetratricopeptide repeat protein [Ignavibacteriae bacterium]|nr:tetratricopeptide repeat protein [Ignavibacteria bacterium]MBI3365627.1 tetratricopeptide repeat protein [Ignavibacteriota bacterium]
MILIAVLSTALASVLTCQQQNYQELVNLADKCYNNKEYENSGEYYDSAFTIQQGTLFSYYNAACSWALAGNKTKALEYLNQSADLGWQYIDHLKKDTDLNSLHQTKEWAELINKVEKKIDEYESHLNKPLMRELEAINDSDQRNRMMMDSVQKRFGWDSKEMKELWSKQNKIDSLDLSRIKEVIKEYGYPGKSLVGDQSSTAWLVIQHADLKTQEEYLPILREATNKGELSKSSFALLVDRVRMGKGEKQLYGSQIQMKNGKYEIYPIEDEPNVNKRRAEVELGPLEDYVKQWGIEYKVPAENKH